jgi:MYXO-CTERM domain-containing protein
MRFRLALASAAALLALAWPGAAMATPTFPGVIQRFVGSAMPPPCTICHNNPSGGIGTVTTTFGKYMRMRGLVLLDENSLRVALMAAQGEMHISNSDGITDLDALRAGEDPNNPKASASTEASPPNFGCGAQIAASTDAGNGAAIPLVLIGGIGVRRRRRERARRRPIPGRRGDSECVKDRKNCSG